MTTAAIQRPVTFPGRFDVKRINDIGDQRKKGPKQGRYVEIYGVSTNPMDHSIDAGDLLFQMNDAKAMMTNRYVDAERNKTMLSQQPAVSVNLRGLTCDDERYQKYQKDGTNENKRKQRAARDLVSVIAVAKYNCLYNPETNDQKDPALMVSGTIDSLMQHNVKAGDLLMWDVPIPGRKQKAGHRDIKKLDKIRVEIVPLSDNARVSMDGLIEWCEKVQDDATKRLFRDATPDKWIGLMDKYIGDDANFFWTKEGEFLYTLLEARNKYYSIVGAAATFQGGDVAMLLVDGYSRWMRIIHKAKQLKHSFNVESKEAFFACADAELFAEVQAMLECLGRLIGKCTRGAEAGQYADWVVEMM